MEKNDYLCPTCKGHLNAGGKVIFTARNTRNKKGLVLLSPSIGTYDYEHHDNLIFIKGKMVDFYCPICAADLASDKNDQYAGIIMVDHNNQEYEILFSRKSGERSTYVVAKDEGVEMFGEDALSYDDLFEEY